jgi:enoyl-CoA hydratase/carnithine racemase
MAIVEWRKEGTVSIVVMNTAENRHNPWFVESMLKAFDEIEADEEIKSVVIHSSDKKNWSLGIDLEWITGAIAKNETQVLKDFVNTLNRLFIRILTFPMPVIAAMNGHAFGDGTVLACACDFRFMRADRGFFCFPEVDINIPFLPGMLAIMRKSMPYHKLEELVYSGKKAGGKELNEHNVIMKACENEAALMEEVLAFARSFNKGRKIFYQHKFRLHKHIIDIIEKEDPAYIESLNLMV